MTAWPAVSQTMKTLLTSPWFEVAHRREGVVIVARTDREFESIDEIDRAHGEVERVFDSLSRAKLGIVVDLRRARARNDPEFERAMEPHRKRLFDGFARRAIIVKSAVGRLHVQRHARQDGHTDLQVFLDVPSAIAFASGA